MDKMGIRAEDIFVDNTISVGGLPLLKALTATPPEQCTVRSFEACEISQAIYLSGSLRSSAFAHDRVSRVVTEVFHIIIIYYRV